MDDVRDSSVTVGPSYSDISNAHALAVVDFEAVEFAKTDDFMLRSQGFCTLCHCDIGDSSTREHCSSVLHLLLYKEYMSKYSMLMHIKSTLYPSLHGAETRLCAAYDHIVNETLPRRNNVCSKELWEAAFRYTAGQRTFRNLLESGRNNNEDSTSSNAQSRTQAQTQAPQCVCCWSTDRNIMFRPCKHVVTCTDCANRISECPICRQSITERESVFCS